MWCQQISCDSSHTPGRSIYVYWMSCDSVTIWHNYTRTKFLNEYSCTLTGESIPNITWQYCYTHQGELISTQHPREFPVTPLPLPSSPNVDTSSKMVYVWMTSYTIDSAAHLHWESGDLKYNIPHDQVNVRWHLSYIIMWSCECQVVL